jgi:hypothetical protein
MLTDWTGITPYPLSEVLAGSPEGSVHEVASTLTLTDALAAAGVSA